MSQAQTQAVVPVAGVPAAVTAAVTAVAAAAVAPPEKASLAQVGRAVFWSFIGIRKSAGHQNDIAKIKPAQVIVAGLIGAALVVTSLIILVKILTAK